MGAASVSISNWNACYNAGSGIVALSCRVTAAEGEALISAVGLVLNDGAGNEIASMYVELAEETSLASPALNVPAGTLKLGDQVIAAATGEADGEHFFFEQTLSVENC